MTSAVEREEIVRALDAIAKANGGVLRPEDVVKEAASKSSVLHDVFEWDNRIAAQAYRIDQARTLIRSIRVVRDVKSHLIPTIYYVRDPTCEADEQGYVQVASLIGKEEKARAVLVAEFSRAGGALRRARELAAVFSLSAEVEELELKVEGLKDRVAVEQPAATQ